MNVIPDRNAGSAQSIRQAIARCLEAMSAMELVDERFARHSDEHNAADLALSEAQNELIDALEARRPDQQCVSVARNGRIWIRFQADWAGQHLIAINEADVERL